MKLSLLDIFKISFSIKITGLISDFFILSNKVSFLIKKTPCILNDTAFKKIFRVITPKDKETFQKPFK